MSSSRIIFLVAILLMYSITTTSQQVIFEYQYGTPDKAEFAYDMVETNDGGYLMVGITMNNPNPTNTLDGKIKKTDANGNFLWEKTYTGMQNTNDFLVSVLKKDNGYLLAGSRFIFSPLPPWYIKTQFWLLEIDENGNLLQQKNYGGDDDEGASKIIATNDGGFLMIGFTKTFGTQQGGQDIWLLKINSAYDTIWSKIYDLGGVDNATDIISWNNKYIILAGSCIENCNTIPGGLGVYKSNAYIIVIDSMGNTESIHNISPGYKNHLTKIAPTQDGGFILTGATDKAALNYSPDLWVVKLNASLDTSWTKIYGKHNTYDGGRTIFQWNDGNYIVAGYCQSFVIPNVRDYDCPWIMMLNPSGDSIWSFISGSVNNDGITEAIIGSDNSIVATGYYDLDSKPESLFNLDLGNGKFYLLKLLPTASSGSLSSDDNHHDVSIVLSHNKIQIVCSEKNFEYTLFDITGKTIIKGINNKTIDIESFNKGIYFIQVRTLKKQYSQKVVIY